ncbi:hypothetical protein BK809_0000148 [Diplodia seriata]|uniref:Nucleoside phosphorylase domain-containing protein n=1 Tax=Diplodia seriata TaxID=420778 RepID=A0A1S8BA03_9PEZI|nr:hypothetical protein BK809_0000148 [Diplodia seriata]
MATDAELSAEDYNVAWICALPDVELDPARLMLDDEHTTPSIDRNFDDTTYICGRVEEHRVVVACLPEGETGNVSVSRLTYPLFRSFPNIKIALLVGIGGGVPRPSRGGNPLDEIYLGDVVIGFPGDGEDAVVYYDRGKVTVDGGYERKGRVQDPDWHIKQALGILQSNHRLKKTKFNNHLMKPNEFPEFAMPERDQDYLFKPEYHHKKEGKSCESCDTEQLVQRPKRTDAHRNTFVFHKGRIATGNSVIKKGERRDEISKNCGGVLCIEMEAAGVNVNGSCLVIGGISDYADSHKNDMWKLHAAKNAAVFARELLHTIQASKVKTIREHVRSEKMPVLAQEPGPETKLPSTIALDHNNTSESDTRWMFSRAPPNIR